MSWNFGLDFGSALGGIVGAVASNASASKQYKYQRALQEQAARLNYEYGLKSLENSPTSQRKGLETAGYNPMLAVQNSTSGANAGWTTTGQAQSQDISGSIANALDLKRVDNETKIAESTVNLQHEQAKTENDKRINFRFDSMMKDAKKHMTDKLTSWIDREKNAQIYKDMQQAEQARAIASVQSYNAETARISANASAKYNDTIKEIADKHSPSGKSQSFRNYTGGVSDILNGVGHVIHGYNESVDTNSSNDSETVYYDKNGNVRGSVSHKGKSNSRSNKKHKRR